MKPFHSSNDKILFHFRRCSSKTALKDPFPPFLRSSQSKHFPPFLRHSQPKHFFLLNSQSKQFPPFLLPRLRATAPTFPDIYLLYYSRPCSKDCRFWVSYDHPDITRAQRHITGCIGEMYKHWHIAEYTNVSVDTHAHTHKAHVP